MTCESRDEALLMLAHGALDGKAAWRTRAHLLVCPRCRARLRRIEGLTASLANALRNPRLGARTLGRAPGSPWASASLLTLLLAVLGGIVASEVAASTSDAPPLGAASRAARPAPACRAGHASGVAPKGEAAKADRVDSVMKSRVKSNLSASHCDR